MMEVYSISFVEISDLTTKAVTEWLRTEVGSHSIGCPIHQEPLNGCLLARRGAGFVFLCSKLDERERCFTVAHECAHFFLHYLQPRNEAIHALGPGILGVLDGDRPATIAERAHGAIAGVPLGGFIDMMARDRRRSPPHSVVEKESEADLLALELLAPSSVVRGLINERHLQPVEVAEAFGIPVWAATSWLQYLISPDDSADPLISFIRGRRKIIEK